MEVKDGPRFFTPAEVAAHNTAADLWVSFLGKVCDLTPLMERHKGERRWESLILEYLLKSMTSSRFYMILLH